MRSKHGVACISNKILANERGKNPYHGFLVFEGEFGHKLRVAWRAQLGPEKGTLLLSYGVESGTEIHGYVVDVPLVPQTVLRGQKWWAFRCPLARPRCKKIVRKLYLSEDGYFGCTMCTDVRDLRFWNHDPAMDGLKKNPGKVADLLASKTVPMERKLRILQIADLILARRQRLIKKLVKLERQLARIKSNPTHPQ